jgi:hypothetical protein
MFSAVQPFLREQNDKFLRYGPHMFDSVGGAMRQ